jgi:excisionase family DNA binding protein
VAAVDLPSAEDVRRIVREEIERALRSAQPEVMTVEQAAAYTGRAPKTVRGWMLAGLPYTRKGRRINVKRADLDEWMSRPAKAGETDALVASLRSTG